MKTTAPSAPESFVVESLPVSVYPSLDALARAAAEDAVKHVATLLESQKTVSVVLAAAASQVSFLEQVTRAKSVDWSRVVFFHMDEYLGLPAEHPASFRRFIRERVAQHLPSATFHYLAGDALEPITECERYAAMLRSQPIDLCCLGVGENGHLAFNDPPVADFHDPRIVKIVKLDEACRRQQVGEGAFPALEAVPTYALTLSIPALCAARRMICVCPEKRKAAAIQAMLEGPVIPACPASILVRKPFACLYLDQDSARLLTTVRQRR
jgi:glucosamine-6-phosphate deaminase